MGQAAAELIERRGWCRRAGMRTDSGLWGGLASRAWVCRASALSPTAAVITSVLRADLLVIISGAVGVACRA